MRHIENSSYLFLGAGIFGTGPWGIVYFSGA